MSCELLDHLNALGFSHSKRCPYENRCRFANTPDLNLFEAKDNCQAITDEQNHCDMTPEDFRQEEVLRGHIGSKCN
jgi:hypothetical protein